jgi:hypothetical protein
MKSKLCSVLVVLSIAVLSATAAHADEPGTVGVEETVSETGEPAPAGSDSLPVDKAARKAKRARRVGTALMISAFVAQGFGFASTFGGVAVARRGLLEAALSRDFALLATIPFAPLGVRGFVLAFGGRSEPERIRWAGIGLLEAGAYSGLVGVVGVLAVTIWYPGLPGGEFLFIPSIVTHFGASIAFLIAGGSCIGVAGRRGKGLSQSRRTPAKSPHRGFVVPTISPRPGGLSLGLAGVF